VDLPPHRCYSGSFGGLATAVDTWPVSDCKKATRSPCSWALRLKGRISAESQGFLTRRRHTGGSKDEEGDLLPPEAGAPSKVTLSLTCLDCHTDVLLAIEDDTGQDIEA
jgi:hypothetical protein